MARRLYGTGTVFFDKKRNKYRARIGIGYNDNGNIRYKEKSGTNERELKKWLKLQQKAILLGKYEVKKSKDTIVSIAQRINRERLDLNIIKPATFGRHEATIKIIKNSCIGDIPIQDVTQADITRFYALLTTYSQSQISKVCRIVRQAYKYAVSNDILNKNISEIVPTPKSKKQNKKVLAFTLQQQRDFCQNIKQIPEPYQTMMLLSLFTGMRMGEISALHKTDVDLDNKTILINKTVTRDMRGNVSIGTSAKTYNSTRIVDLNNIAYNILYNYISKMAKPTYLIFTTNSNNGIINTGTVNAEFKKIAPNGYSQHCLRHTFATRCIESGMPAKVLSNILGHSDIKITLNTYCDVFEEYSRQYLENTDTYLQSQGII